MKRDEATGPGASLTTSHRAMDGSPIYTVAELTHEIRDILERHIGTAWVTGEVSNLRRPASGHYYFTLKDELAQLSVVMWRSTAALMKFELKDGLALIVQGEITVYEPRGQYQLVARRAEPVGVGALQAAFLQLKERLAKEGLFAPERKKPIPFFPRRIGIVTSPTGAAVRDMLNIILGRLPSAHVLLCPVRVQGDAAAGEIAEAIAALNAVGDVDVMIVGRGGGSLEDLWPFNAEVVARAIATSRIPVISAVGHETDFTISDFVADVRALTPTDAGNLVVPDVSDLAAGLGSLAGRLGHALMARAESARERLGAVARSYAFRRPLEGVRAREQRLDDLCQQLARGAGHVLQLQKGRLEAAAARMDSLSPLAVLARGYSITFAEPEGNVLRDVRALKAGSLVRTRLSKGAFTARVEEVARREEGGTPRTAAVQKRTGRRATKKK